ncbi:MAG: carboxymuconolactone decarboxylase family protein [Mucilaginibacter sp.]|nr:carboxymuconolactone decarboxylase family protein [Mucilaginibacter sp.]
MARSQAVLVAYLRFSAGLYHASIGMVMGELLALAVSDANGSRYCDAVHTYTSKGLAIAPEIIQQARLGRSPVERVSEVLAFAKSVIASRGADLPPAVHSLKMSNYSEQEIVEIIAQIALSTFSNYINLVASTENDYPGNQ